MKKNAIIWRKSIYDNDYICRCGKTLFKDGKFTKGIMIIPDADIVICPNCKWNVARITTEEEASKTAFRGEKYVS